MQNNFWLAKPYGFSQSEVVLHPNGSNYRKFGEWDKEYSTEWLVNTTFAAMLNKTSAFVNPDPVIYAYEFILQRA